MSGATENELTGDDYDPDFEEWNREFAEKQRRVYDAPNVASGLARLAALGADSDKVLALLVICSPEPATEFHEHFRKKIKSLCSLAKAYESLAYNLETTFSSDFAFAEVWKALLFPIMFRDGGLPNVDSARNVVKREMSHLRSFARALRGEASAFRRLLKFHPRLNHTLYLSSLLRYVYESTGKYRESLLADMLEAAHNELGLDETYSEEKLRKFRQRHLRALIRPPKASWLLHLVQPLLTSTEWDNSPT
jgi:hypothetical protein